jgi:TM2 domain-containing membrane protein YozV
MGLDAAAIKTCPYCAETILVAAKKCKHCGEFLEADYVHKRSASPEWNPGIAAVLSLIIPGAGQMYRGQVGLGLLWLLGIAIAYFYSIWAGLPMHLLCVWMAAERDTPSLFRMSRWAVIFLAIVTIAGVATGLSGLYGFYSDYSNRRRAQDEPTQNAELDEAWRIARATLKNEKPNGAVLFVAARHGSDQTIEVTVNTSHDWKTRCRVSNQKAVCE